jgi:hypothetical protein
MWIGLTGSSICAKLGEAAAGGGRRARCARAALPSPSGPPVSRLRSHRGSSRLATWTGRGGRRRRCASPCPGGSGRRHEEPYTRARGLKVRSAGHLESGFTVACAEPGMLAWLTEMGLPDRWNLTQRRVVDFSYCTSAACK